MKISLLLVIITLSGFASFAARQADPAFTIKLSAEQPTMKVGAEVLVKIMLTNTSGKDLDVSANISNLTGADPNYVYDVRDSKGKSVPKRIFAHPELATGRAVIRTLPSGQTLTDYQDLNRIFLIKHPGKYTVRVSRQVPGQVLSVSRLSAPLVLTLTP